MFQRSLRIGRIAGVELRVHWSILFTFLYFYMAIRPVGATSFVLLFVVVALLFVSITLHELGHALAARRFGIPTRQIVLWPLGGLAMLEREPARPRDDLIIAGAGPLVSLLIAGAVALAGWALDTLAPVWEIQLVIWLGGALWPFYLRDLGAMVVQQNLMLAGFNLLPIYPLDGGRMLQAAVAMRGGQRWANRVGLVAGLPLAVGLLVYFVILRSWLSVAIALLLIVVIARLDPRLQRWGRLAFSAIFNRARYHFLRGDYERAVAAASAQIARRPDDLAAYHHRAAAYHHLRQYERALADYDAIVARDPGRVHVLLDRAALHVEQKAYERALADLNQIAALRPDDAMLTMQRGVVRQRAGDGETARAELARAVELAPRHSWAHLVYGGALLWALDLDGAAAALQRALELEPTSAVALSNLALVCHARGDDAGAEQYLARAITADPAFHYALALRGVRRMRAGDLDGAAADLDRAVALSPNEPELAWHRGRLRHCRGDDAGAGAEIERCLALDAEDACVHAPLWLELHVAGDLPWAQHYYAHIIARRPDLSAAYHGRADALRVNGMAAEAIADYDRALELEPGRAGALLGRALARAALGDDPTADARRALECARTLDLRRAAQALLEPAASPAALP